MRNSNRYPNGYIPKMSTWYVQAMIEPRGSYKWRKAMSKYRYFNDKQREVYGDLTKAQIKLLNTMIDDGLAMYGYIHFD